MDAPAGDALQERLHTQAGRPGRPAIAMSLLVFLLACSGTTNIVTGGRIFAGIRASLDRRHPALGYWARCPMCLGFFVGVVWAVAGLWPSSAKASVVELAAAGAMSSGWCWAVRVVLHRMGEDEL